MDDITLAAAARRRTHALIVTGGAFVVLVLIRLAGNSASAGLVVLAVPAAAAFGVVGALGWRVLEQPPKKRRARLVASVVAALGFGVLAALATGIAVWLEGPDCAVVATAHVQLRELVAGTVVGIGASMVPVAVAGKRRASVILGAIPLAAALIVSASAAFSGQSGWCLF